MTRSLTHAFVLALVASVTGACREPDASPWPLPEIVATSKYIEYGTWAEPSQVCMSEKLAEMDRFIEETAEFLEVAVPAEPIVYVWYPILPEEEDWPCSSDTACYTTISSNGYIPSTLPFGVQTTFHEFVHAVDNAGLGRGHSIFAEGLAEYLSRTSASMGTSTLDGFAEKFSAMLEEGITQYGLAMHFVGSVIQKHGVDGFKRLRKEVPWDARLQEFTAAYQRALGENLGSALMEMELQPITGQFPWYCDGEEVPWPDPGDLEVTLRGSCGDGFFWSEGLVEGVPSRWKDFVLDVPEAGIYTLTASTVTSETAGIFAVLDGCVGTESGNILVSDGVPGINRLGPGRHLLRVGLPADAAEPGMIANLKLEFRPLPP
ncbi:hypothetical protein SAMN02745121_01290 [Nannocystis exedens]|uniref:Uncharacterized protein n=1 Tax=Nannocystis exedens TaxID=54 RepID=A0A1I1V158_9BACT|nr:hypothetical protein [Nannocystis exedens]PCC72081.1 hypothetical protein NAEX_05160 [Nannocystis exedens]SFD74010.1 hypothetical protein SAMN02745121_01290 [Nannocystis exedens]